MFRSSNLIVGYAILLHFTWALCLLDDTAAANATAVHTLVHYIPIWQAVIVYVIVAAMALLHSVVKTALLLLPQQFVMMVSAGGAVYAMYLGQFADGVQRSHAFLVADQAPAVIAAVFHTIAILRIIWIERSG
jgi:hypothetical protein